MNFEKQRMSVGRRERRKKQIFHGWILAGIIVLLAVVLFFTVKEIKGKIEKAASEKKEQERIELELAQKIDNQMKEAEYLAATYAYDDAIALLQSIEGYESKEEVLELIKTFEEQKASCVPVKLEEVTHIFYHSLVVDAERAFANQERNPQAAGNNQWMTTVSEFEKITQEMYDRGYVLISIHDMIHVTQDEAGNTVYEPAEIMLPEGKKAFVMSLDDLSYYHAYDGYGYASKLIVDENGDLMNEYIDANGEMHVGAYDVVPLFDQFVKEHPDATYRGAKGMIALTGYNGILGYRSDETYDLSNPNCDIHQKKWITDHPDFQLEAEREQAKKVADAMKAKGWEFASHTWGHLRVGQRSLDSLMKDTEKWKNNVEPLVGPTDTIIFAHGEDLQKSGPYDENNAKYQYFRGQGYSIFCNVDSSAYTTLIENDYMRQGRRNLDGYRIYRNATGVESNLSDLFDAKDILDPLRPPVLPLS